MPTDPTREKSEVTRKAPPAKAPLISATAQRAGSVAAKSGRGEASQGLTTRGGKHKEGPHGGKLLFKNDGF